MTRTTETLRRSLVLLASAVVIGYLLGALKIVEKAERGLSQLFALSFTTAHDDRVVIVAITDDNYRDLFGGQSPLRREPLLKLLQAIAVHEPAVIGVDVDSSTLTDANTLPQAPAVIRARDAFVDADGRLMLEAVPADMPPGGRAVAVLAVDTDGVQRKYQRWMQTITDVPEPSFPYRVARTWRARQRSVTPADRADEQRFQALDDAKSSETLLIDYAHFPSAAVGGGCPAVMGSRVIQGAPPDFRPRCFTAHQVMQSTGSNTSDGAKWQDAFRNRIVLIGGTYAHGGDSSHSTPVGGLAGVEIMAQIVATELEDRGRRPIPVYGALMFFVLLAYLAVPLDPPLSAPMRLLRTLAVGSVAALFASLVGHGTVWVTPRYVLVFVCVLILQTLTGFLKSVTGDAAHAAADFRHYLWRLARGFRARSRTGGNRDR